MQHICVPVIVFVENRSEWSALPRCGDAEFMEAAGRSCRAASSCQSQTRLARHTSTFFAKRRCSILVGSSAAVVRVLSDVQNSACCSAQHSV